MCTLDLAYMHPFNLLCLCCDCCFTNTTIRLDLFCERDIASRNCLVTLNRLTKLGDFGLTRKVGDETDYYRYQRRGNNQLLGQHLQTGIEMFV